MLQVEVKFGERDQIGEFTLRHGDWVQFNIATDRRDHLQKATNISLVDDRLVFHLLVIFFQGIHDNICISLTFCLC